MMPGTVELDDESKEQLQQFLSMYETNYKFLKDSIYYDVKARLLKHFKTFYKLQELCERMELKEFTCFPLRMSFIPSYMTLDAKIVSFNILKKKKPLTNTFSTWGQVVYLKKKAFRKQGGEKNLQFEGTVESDGVYVSAIKQSVPTTRRGPGNTAKKSKNNDKFEVQYIETLPQEQLIQTIGKCVLVDPGRHDLLYYTLENSTPDEKNIITFTKNCHEKCSRHFKSLRKHNIPAIVKEAEAALSKTKLVSVNLAIFLLYIKKRTSVKDILYAYVLWKRDDKE